MKKSTPTGITPTRIAVDIGGTFTDIALDTGNTLYTARTLTTQDDPVRGVIEVIRTAITNALIERNGARVGLITKKAARQTYGVCLKRDGSVDTPATRLRRRA
jgi:N-methylhydantoinase A